jgi:hypothetical protein
MPMCAFKAHVRSINLKSEVLRLGRREEREAQGEARHPVEEIVFHIEHGDLLDILEHPNPDRYAGQRIFVVRREDYVYLVPFVEDEHTVFLKTIIPSRKATPESHEGVPR